MSGAVAAQRRFAARREEPLCGLSPCRGHFAGSVAWFVVETGTVPRPSESRNIPSSPTPATRETWAERMGAGSIWTENLFPIEQVAVSGGEIEPVPSITLAKPMLHDVSPDGSTFLVQSYRRRVAHATALQR